MRSLEKDYDKQRNQVKQLQEAQVRASLMSVEAAAAAQGLAAAKAENIELKAEVGGGVWNRL